MSNWVDVEVELRCRIAKLEAQVAALIDVVRDMAAGVEPDTRKLEEVGDE